MTASDVERSARHTGAASISEVLRIKSARDLQLADVVSGTGDALYWVALVVVLVGADSSGAALAAAVIARLLPRLLFGPIAGVVVDRFDRALLMMFLDGARAVLMVVLAVAVAMDAAAAIVVVIVFAVGVLGTPYRPAATAQLATAVGERLLAPANAVAVSVGQAVGLTGPLLATVLLAVAAPPWAFAVNALTFVAAMVLVRRTRNTGSSALRFEPAGKAGWTTALREGLTTVRRQDGLAVVLALVATLTLVRGAEMVLYVSMAEHTLGLGAGGYGLVAGAVGAGALIALPLANRAGRAVGSSASLISAAIVSVVPLGVLAAINHVIPALPLLALQGAAFAVFEVLALTTTQRLCPPASIGRVLGLQTTTSGGAKLLGSVIAPIAIASIGLRGGLVAVSVGAVVGVVVLAVPVLALGRRLRQRRTELTPTVDKLASLGIFAWASLPSIERVAMQLTARQVRAGTTVIRQGDVPDDFYVVVSGQLVVDTGGQVINRLRPDDWFGELGLLHGVRRTATVTAESECLLWRISGDELVTALTAGTTLPDALVDDMRIRIARSDAVAR